MRINGGFVAHVSSLACSSAAAAYYSEPVLCPSVLQLTQTPTDDELLTG